MLHRDIVSKAAAAMPLGARVVASLLELLDDQAAEIERLQTALDFKQTTKGHLQGAAALSDEERAKVEAGLVSPFSNVTLKRNDRPWRTYYRLAGSEVHMHMYFSEPEQSFAPQEGQGSVF